MPRLKIKSPFRWAMKTSRKIRTGQATVEDTSMEGTIVKKDKGSHFERLPLELWSTLAEYLTLPQIFKLRRVSKAVMQNINFLVVTRTKLKFKG